MGLIRVTTADLAGSIRSVVVSSEGVPSAAMGDVLSQLRRLPGVSSVNHRGPRSLRS